MFARSRLDERGATVEIMEHRNAGHALVGAAADQDPSSRLARIVGNGGVARLRGATVMVLGLGGVGSNCAEALARGGVGGLVLLDRDEVQGSNINRQALAFASTVGRRKVDVMREMVFQINPHARVETHDRALLPADVEGFLDAYAGRVDYVIDAIDTVATKLSLAEYAAEHSGWAAGAADAASDLDQAFPLVSCMGAANKMHPENFAFADIYDTVNCPLCRIMRKELRRRGVPSLVVLYSSEEPVRVMSVEGAARSERSNLGTMSYAPPIMGQLLASFVIRRLLGIELEIQQGLHPASGAVGHPAPKPVAIKAR